MKKTLFSAVSSALAMVSLVGCAPMAKDDTKAKPVTYTPVPCDPGGGKLSKCVGTTDAKVMAPAAPAPAPAPVQAAAPAPAAPAPAPAPAAPRGAGGASDY